MAWVSYLPRDGGLRSRSCAEHYSKGQLNSQQTKMLPGAAFLGVPGDGKTSQRHPWKNLALCVCLVLQHAWDIHMFPGSCLSNWATKWVGVGCCRYSQARTSPVMHSGACLAPSSWGGHTLCLFLAWLWEEGAKPPRPVVLTQWMPSEEGNVREAQAPSSEGKDRQRGGMGANYRVGV